MIDQDSLPTGSLEEVEQAEETPIPFIPIAVPVIVENVVAVHQTGSKHGVSFNRKMLSANGAEKVLAANPKRRIVRMIADQAFYYGVYQQGLTQGAAALWIANTPLEITHCEDIWIYFAIDGLISVISEDWAD